MIRSLAALALVAASAGDAYAHTRPAALTGAHQRADGSLVVGATWGLAYRDAGEWSLGCAAAFAVDADVEDAKLALDGDGTIVLGTFDGLYESDDGCTFTQPEGPLADGWVVDVVADGSGGVWAALTNVFEADQLYHRDAGGEWRAIGEPLDALVSQLHVHEAELWRVTFLPLAADRPRQVFLERSVDGGLAWRRWEVALEGSEWSATVLAVRGGEVHLVVRHFDGEAVPERVLRFDLAAERFVEVHRAPVVEAGRWTAEGLWLLGRLGGLDLSADGTTFERMHEVGGRCLTLIDGSLAACLDPASDGAALGFISRASVDPIVRLADLDGLRECPAGSDAASVCPAFREALAEDVQVPVDGVPPPGTPSGCGCALTRERAPVAEGAFVVGLLALQRRRRRKNARAAPTSAKP